MNFFSFATFFAILISFSFIKCNADGKLYPVEENIYNLSNELENQFLGGSNNAYHRTISVFGKEYHFYPDGQVYKSEKYAIGQLVQTIMHQSTAITELEFDDFLNTIEMPQNVNIIRNSEYWDNEFGSINIALAFLIPDQTNNQ